MESPRQNLLGVEIDLFAVRKSNPGDSILGEKKFEIFFMSELKSRWKYETPSTNLSIVPGMPCPVYHWSVIFWAISAIRPFLQKNRKMLACSPNIEGRGTQAAIRSPMGNDVLYLSR
jgi:hypothetical protein